MKLSVGIITKNEEYNLSRTLEAIKDIADEIIIVDNGSEDKTEEIAKQFNAHFFTEEWKGYGKQKNSVLEKCKGEWILLIDADEVVSLKLKERISNIINSPNSHNAYSIKRCPFFLEKEMRNGGLHNEYILRLWKNGSVTVSEDIVHEKFITHEQIGKINERLLHYTYNTLDEYFVIFKAYSTLGAQKYFDANKRSNLFQITIKPGYSFIKNYFFRLGFINGVEGFLLASLTAMFVMVKYYKLRKLNKQKE